MAQHWTVPPLWSGQTAYIIGGGPSVTPEMLESIKGRLSMAVNMSYLTAPWSTVMFFADLRLWERETAERQKSLDAYAGVIATTNMSAKGDRLLRLKRVVPDSDATGFSTAKDTVSMERTSLQGAMNLCYHLGSRRMVLLGADNRDAPNGRQHYHEEYPWVRFQDSWVIKQEQFGYAAAACKHLGVEVINCSPVSTLPFWPIRPLADVLKEGR